MLYDPKWEQQTKSDPFTLESLIAWLENRPSLEAYAYHCNGHCLLAQYFSAAGFKNVHMFCAGFWAGEDKCPTWVGQEEAHILERLIAMPPTFDQIATSGARTFGAALMRARSALKRARPMPSPNGIKP